MEVIKLSHLKLSDEGVQLLSRKPLDSLRELDLSHTNITSRALRVLSQGTSYFLSVNRCVNVTIALCVHVCILVTYMFFQFTGAPCLEILNIENTKV